jgi:cell division protease FtsH
MGRLSEVTARALTMTTQQSRVAEFTRELADLAIDLQQGTSCLVECQKELTHFLYLELRDRLLAQGLRCLFIDGRPRVDEPGWEECGVITTMLAQLRKAAWGETERRVIALPYLDLLAASRSGLTFEVRELVPVLYDDPEQVWLGFQDPTLPLLPIVEQRFKGRYHLLPRSA